MTRAARPATQRGRGKCEACDDTGHVCENHPDLPWGGISTHIDACECGAGMPCPKCCKHVPHDGTHSIIECFTPARWRAPKRKP
jgi:hypothetical protein